MNKVKLRLVSENKNRIVYEIIEKYYYIDNKKFKINKSLSNLSRYLNETNKNLYQIFDVSNKCLQCGKETKISFSRNELSIFKFCSIKCHNLYKKDNTIYNCPICEKEFLYKEKDKKFYGTCGNIECIDQHKKNRNKNISKTHWTKGKDSDKIHSNKIKTRLENDRKFNRKYVPWNKGKKNVYSKETIEKIRNATIKQMSDGKIKKTKIEIKIEQFLIEQNINYKYSFILNKRQYDFIIKDHNLLIEADGDYWHGNPSKYKELSDRQILKQKDDRIKDRIAKENGFEIIRFWESDIYNKFDEVKNKIIEKINE